MSTFLQLSQKTAQECLGDSTSLTTVSGLTGEHKRIVDWVAQAWTEIQLRHEDWRWMRKEFTLTTSASDGNYAFGDCTDVEDSAAITRFSRWRLNDPEDPPRIYLQSTGTGGETWMSWIAWEHWKLLYQIGANRTTEGFPAHISVDPDDNIRLGPVPDAAYVITGDYWRSAQTLSANGDTPEMPAQFHDLVVYRAMESYALFESAQEVMVRALRGQRRLMRGLERQQLPRIRRGRPLA